MRFAPLLLFLVGCIDPADPQFSSPASVPFYVVSSQPMSGQREVPTDSVIVIDLSDVPWPADVPAAWELHTGNLHTTGVATADLVDRRLRVRAARGMLAELTYTLTLRSTLHSFAGASLRQTQIQFTTGRTAGGAPPPPPARSLRADVVPALAPCASCHGGEQPAQSLDLSTAQGVLAAVLRPSQMAADTTLIAPADHADSYLVWKALGLPRTVGHQADTVPPLDHDAARVVADWIDEGAKDD